MVYKKKKIRPKAGDIFQVPLANGTFGYGQLVDDTSEIFFDYQDKGGYDNLQKIASSKVLFKITVDSLVIKNGLWPIIGNSNVSPKLIEDQDNFIYDPSRKVYFIWKANNDKIPAAPGEIYNLECLASWGAKHVEQRLLDYFAGRPNFDVESFRNQHNPNFEKDIVKFYKQYGYDFKFEDE